MSPDGDFLQHEFDTEVDLTPLIDVVFMLLLFFILASTFIQPALRVALPAAQSAAALDKDSERLVLSIDEGGSLHHADGPMAPDGLAEWLERRPDRAVTLRVDRRAPFQSFIGVLDRLRLAGREDVAITALPSP